MFVHNLRDLFEVIEHAMVYEFYILAYVLDFG